MKIAISAESTIDLTKELLEKYDIHTVPFTVNLGNRTGLDGEITPQEIMEYVAEFNTLPKTSAVNHYQYTEYFNELLQSYDAVIHFSLSSDMSSAYSNAFAVSQEIPNVYVIDSRSLSTGIALLAIYASKLVNKGIKPFDIVNEVTKRIPNDQASFVLMRLDFLYKGGRCNALSYLGAALLKIRPQILVINGKMQPRKKYVGKMDRCIIKYVDDILEEYTTPDLEEVFLTYTTATPEQIVSVKKKLTERGFKNIHITTAGATITSHCGEGCLGILFLNDGDASGKYQGL